MPDPDFHNDQGAHNAQIRDLLSGEAGCSDWEMTMLFYAALHFVEAVLHRKHRVFQVHNHKQRMALVRRHFPSIADDYEALLQSSYQARYDGARFAPEQIRLAADSVVGLRAYLAGL